MTRQETIDRLKGKHGLTMADLRDFVDKNTQIEDDTPVLIERVKDLYFNENGWNVYKHKGFHYKQAVMFNISISNGKEVLSSGDSDKIEELEYEPEFIEKAEIWSEEILDDMKEQFYSGHCIVEHDGLVLIYSHY